MFIDGHLDSFYKWQKRKLEKIASSVFEGIRKYIDSHQDDHTQSWEGFRDGLEKPIRLVRREMLSAGLRYGDAEDVLLSVPEASEPKYKGFVRFVVEDAYGLNRSRQEVSQTEKLSLQDLLFQEIGIDPRDIRHVAEFFVAQGNCLKERVRQLEEPELELVG